MRWTALNNPIRRGFAWLPVTLCDGPTKETIWLRPYWYRYCGYFREVWFDEPTELLTAALNPTQDAAHGGRDDG